MGRKKVTEKVDSYCCRLSIRFVCDGIGTKKGITMERKLGVKEKGMTDDL